MTKVKICGITNLKDAQVAIEAGADLLGFIFYEPSPRYVAPERVKEIVARLRAGAQRARNGRQDQEPEKQINAAAPPHFVGVFVNTPFETVGQILEFCQLDAAQLHGEESPEFVSHFTGRAFKALRPQSQAEANSLLQKYQAALPVQDSMAWLPGFLIDAYHPSLYGGTGHVTDWTMAANIARHYPILLAGSLTPGNVVEAIRAVQPWGVDVSSGVEAEKGRKDHAKVRQFIQAVREMKPPLSNL